jgi:hypothetical protein
MAEGQTRHRWEDWAGTRQCSRAPLPTTGRGVNHMPRLWPTLSQSTSTWMVTVPSSTSVAGQAPPLCSSPTSSRASLVSTQIPECWLRPTALARRITSPMPAGCRCEPRISPGPLAPFESSASPSRSTGWTGPGSPPPCGRCLTPMASSFKSTFGTRTRRTMCHRVAVPTNTRGGH